MEQKAKADWDIRHQGDPNPCACLPRMNIFPSDFGKPDPEYAECGHCLQFLGILLTSLQNRSQGQI